jgi:Putative MetA-pathway of phenol degradation
MKIAAITGWKRRRLGRSLAPPLKVAGDRRRPRAASLNIEFLPRMVGRLGCSLAPPLNIGIALIGAVAFASSSTAGQRSANGPTTDPTAYILWNPVPRGQLREMSTDRPDQTESPYTVDAGHVQLEMDIVSFTHDHTGGETVEEWNFAPLNFKVGLLPNVDVQFVLGGWIRSETRRDGELKQTASGIGDLTVRVKANFWGNDGGPTAMGVMPFVKFPLKSDAIGNDEIEGGLILPFAWNLSGRLHLGLMTEIDRLADEEGGGHHFEWINSVTLGADITDRLGAYAEFAAVLAEGGGEWTGQIDTGVTYALTDDIQLDAGCNFGVTETAPDYQPFVGLSIRF